MSSDGQTNLSPAEAGWIDALCDQFEKGWRTGRRPRIEECLAELPAACRPALLSELLILELAYRHQAGEQPEPAEYHGRFPGEAAAVDAAFTAFQAYTRLGDDPECTRVDADQGTGAAGPTTAAVGAVTSGGGRFRILRFHDRGALGEVYVARDEELHRDVALKQIRHEHADDAQRRARFLVEAEITGALEHPGIVPVYGLGRYENGRPFYAMRLIQGDNLKSAIERFHQAGPGWRGAGGRAVQFRRLLGRFLDACNAVAYAHSRGVLHRDLKPGNIMLGKFGETLVVDWGLAKAVGQDDLAAPGAERNLNPESGSEVKSTEIGERVGTPAFMSPEQAAGRLDELGPASDVYSLGATLYCLLTGNPPFVDSELAVVLRQVEQGSFPPPAAVNPEVDQALDAICSKAMALRPQDRYASPRALADDIEHWLADEPVAARPESGAQRLWRWLRRHRSWARAGAAALVLVTLVSILAVGFVYQARTREAQRRREAEQHRREADMQRLEAERRLARLALHQGLNLCAQGDTHRGILWLARALQIAPADAADFRRSIRINLDAWTQGFHRLLEYVEHEKAVTRVRFRADGKLLATASADGTARLWDAATLAPLGSPLRHQSFVWDITFNPDGKVLATACDDGTAQLWDVAGCSSIGSPLQHEGAVYDATFSPDGKVLATASADGSVRLWDVATLGSLGPPIKHNGRVLGVAFRPDGNVLATACDSGAAQLWDAATGKPLGPPLYHSSGVQALTFDPEGKVLATACNDRTARLWDADTLKPIGSPLRHRGWVRDLTFSPDGKLLATASDDYTAQLWDAATLAPLGPPLQHALGVYNVAFRPDGKVLATASSDGTARLWDVATRTRAVPPLQQPGAGWAIIAFSPDGKLLAASCGDATVRIWDPATRNLRKPQLKHSSSLRALTFRPDGKVLATACGDGAARLWDMATFTPLGALLQHQGPVTDIAFRPDGKVLATASNDSTARLWDARTLAPLVPPLQHQGWVEGVAFSPDGRVLATACDDNTAWLWDAATGTPRGSPLRHQGAVWHATFSPDGKLIATTSNDRTARLWDTATLRPAGPPLVHQGAVCHAAFSPDRKLLATGSVDGTARLWDVATGTPIGPSLQHPEAVENVAFAPGGKLLATASNDGTLGLWEVPAPLEGDAEQIVRWTEVLSAMELDASDVVGVLSSQEWERRRAALGRFDVPSSGSARLPEYGDNRDERAAARAEAAGQWLVALGYLDRLVLARPGDGSLHARRGHAFFKLRRWPEAAESEGRAIALGAARLGYPWLFHECGVACAWLGRWEEADVSFAADVASSGETNSWFYDALLRIHLGDIVGYRDTCQRMFARWGADSEFRSAHRLARACILGPDAVSDLEQLVGLADGVVTRDPGNLQWHVLRGAACYRAGRYYQARGYLEEAIKRMPDSLSTRAWGTLYLAMTLACLGHRDDARKCLDQAARWIDREVPNRPPQTAPNPAFNWDERLLFPLLRREAEALITNQPLYLPANVFQDDARPGPSGSSGNP
jgi:WD40 repeat protein/tetratricopeptide (TPR) repeat protein/tRNA A-37 threonylcarbamoyl transferase component Bud32